MHFKNIQITPQWAKWSAILLFGFSFSLNAGKGSLSHMLRQEGSSHYLVAASMAPFALIIIPALLAFEEYRIGREAMACADTLKSAYILKNPKTYSEKKQHSAEKIIEKYYSETLKKAHPLHVISKKEVIKSLALAYERGIEMELDKKMHSHFSNQKTDRITKIFFPNGENHFQKLYAAYQEDAQQERLALEEAANKRRELNMRDLEDVLTELDE